MRNDKRNRSMTGFLIAGMVTLVLAASCSIIDFEEIKDKAGIGKAITVPGAGLLDKLSWIKANAKSDGTYIIEVDKDEALNLSFYNDGLSDLYYNKDNVTVHLKGIGAERTIKTDPANINFSAIKGNPAVGYLFRVGNGVTLILDENITLQGPGSVSGFSMAEVISLENNTKLIMNTGSKITSNADSITAVEIYNNGTFTMNGGEISGIDWGVTIGNTGAFTMNGGAISVTYEGIEAWDSGTFTMNGGIISGCTGAVTVFNESTFTMNGGEISGCSFDAGGGVGVFGTFIMNGGKISGNTVTDMGGGVDIYGTGTFIMNNGEISGCTAYDGGGVFDDGTFNMKGGVISGCSSLSGGGVYVNLAGTFTMYGGEISGNTAGEQDSIVTGGGGVYANGTFTMNGGKISGNTASQWGGGVLAFKAFTMNGGEISGNTASWGGGVDIFDSVSSFRISGGTVYGSDAADEAKRNNAASGAAFDNYIWANGLGTAQYGTFSGNTWNSKGDLTSTDNTIKVVNGELQ